MGETNGNGNGDGNGMEEPSHPDLETTTTPAMFETTEQERDLCYWKDKYDEVRDLFEDAKMEVEMIQLQSQEQESHVQSLGDELELLTQQLEETSRQLEDVRWERDEAKREKEEVRRRLGEEVRGLNEGIAGMQLSIDNLTSERDNAKRAVVALEQGNDDLEREHRNAHSSFLDIESKYNRLVEEMVLLEEDLRDKTALGEEVQRLKDVVREQTDEMAYLIGQADKHRRAHEEALETIHRLEGRVAPSEDKESPLRQSKSAILLSTPSPPTARQGPNSMFMPPVSEHIDNSPRPTISSASTSHTLRPLRADDSPGTPSQLPVLRPGRVDSLRSRRGRDSPGSPGTGGMRRSQTISNLSPSPRSSAYDLAPARGLNRSTNSRHLNGLVGSETPTRARPQYAEYSPSPFAAREKRASMYGHQLRPLDVSTSSNATVTTLGTARKQSTGASSALAGQQAMTSKTSMLLSRMGKLGNKSTAASVRSGNTSAANISTANTSAANTSAANTSAANTSAANTSSTASSYGEPKPRVISRKASFSQMAHQGVHAIANQFHRSQRGGRVVSSASVSSNRTVMALQQQEQETDLTMIEGSPSDNGWVQMMHRSEAEKDGDSPTDHTNRGKTFRDRFKDEGSGRQEFSMASTSTHSGPLPIRSNIPPSMMNKVPATRPTQTQSHERSHSRMSSQLSTVSSSSTRAPTPSGIDNKVPYARPESRTGARSRTTTASISMLPRPQSRQDHRPQSRQDYNRGMMRSPSPTTSHSVLPSGLPQPQYGNPTANITTSRSIRRSSAQLGQPGKQRLADPPGSATNVPVKSRIPRKSTGARPASTIEVPEAPVPALPVSASRATGMAGIGRGLPSTAR